MRVAGPLLVFTAAILGILMAIDIIRKWDTDPAFWNRLMFNQKPITVPIQTFKK